MNKIWMVILMTVCLCSCTGDTTVSTESACGQYQFKHPITGECTEVPDLESHTDFSLDGADFSDMAMFDMKQTSSEDMRFQTDDMDMNAGHDTTDSGGSLLEPCRTFGDNRLLCKATESTCHVIFQDGVGCEETCRQQDLRCVESYENQDGQCLADYSKPPLQCNNTNHQSDYCVCAKLETCQLDCGERACGGDGCGGSCGFCAEGSQCNQDGECVPTQGATNCIEEPYNVSGLLSECIGFGCSALGGDLNNVYHVTTLNDSGAGSLRSALESTQNYWIVFDVEGVIQLNSGRIEVESNKTLDGRDKDIHIQGNLVIRNKENIIITDIKLSNPLEGYCTQDGDVLSIRGTRGATAEQHTTKDIWVHQCEIFDGGDGLLDIRGGSNITISRTHFHKHKKGLLMSTDDNDDDTPNMHVTMHHNFFDRISLRGPQFIHGKAHFFNNYQYQWYEYGAGSLGEAQFFSERNVYEARPGNICTSDCADPNPCGDRDFFVSKRALVNEWSGNGQGNIKSVGDLLLEDAEIEERRPQAVFNPKDYYQYSADVADVVLISDILQNTGPRTNYCR